jgi:ribosome-associated protein
LGKFDVQDQGLMTDRIPITGNIAIPLDEVEFHVSRSGGPGGQGVNTSDSRVELRFDVAASPSLTDTQKARLLHVLSGRLDRSGRLRVVSSTHRSQLLNRRAAVERFAALLADALRVRPKRQASKPSRGAKERRLGAKARRASIKRDRQRPRPGDD